MTKQRIAALLCALLLGMTAAAAAQQDTMATYIQPEDVKLCEVGDLSGFTVPEGLQPMYTLMSNVAPTANAYVFLMPNHRVLMSISSAYAPNSGTAQGLLDSWEVIAAALSREADSVNTDVSCAVLDTQYGFDALHITTDMAFTGDVPLTVKADGAAFYRDDELLEVWTVQPAPETYEGDAAAAKELEADLASLAELKASLSFDTTSILEDAEFMAGTVEYQDPDGRFELKLPKDARIVTSATPQQELDRLRESCFATKGWSAVFDEMMKDVQDENAALLLMPEYGLVVQLFCEDDPDFRQYTAENYRGLSEAVRLGLERRFGSATLLNGTGTMAVSGLEHAWLSYWLRAEETDMMLNVFAATDSSGLLREADLFCMMDAQVELTQQENVMELILQSLVYHHPAQTSDPA